MHKIVTMATVITACTMAHAQESTSEFEEPVLLTVGDAPLNAEDKMMYPSPALFDVDNDGQDELVIGTIYGEVFACKNSNHGVGDPEWEAPQAVKMVDGEALKLHNW